jgi:hypothetical protein
VPLSLGGKLKVCYIVEHEKERHRSASPGASAFLHLFVLTVNCQRSTIFAVNYIMKQLTVPFTNAADLNDWHATELISNAPWSKYPYKPEVRFSVRHSGESMFLKFKITEKAIRAAQHQYNSAVYEDSCVECFIAFDGSLNYYNIEINCIGAILMAYGSGRLDRSFIDKRHLKTIGRKIFIHQPDHKGMVEWQLTAMLPASIFLHESIDSLNGKHCRANFYKCGDLLPDPHFLCWSQINAPEPDFHLPEFFGELYFSAEGSSPQR